MKMDIERMSPEQIRSAGIKALTKSMGAVGMALFLRQFDMGNGDWTRERHAVLKEKSIGEIVSKIRQSRKKK